jgi:hypothetical protein
MTEEGDHDVPADLLELYVDLEAFVEAGGTADEWHEAMRVQW